MDTFGNTSETHVKEFILLGFSYNPQTKIVLAMILLFVYLVNLTANLLFIIVTVADAQLHSPMYSFLCNLSILDLCVSTFSGPTILKGLLVRHVTMTFSECISQMYIQLALGQTECFLLVVMAWDRYVAVCKPLNYHQIMNSSVCVKLTICTWAGGFIFSLSSLIFISVVHFCGQNIIDHILCEAEAVSQLTCMDSQMRVFVVSGLAVFGLVGPIAIIVFTYCQIISTVLRMSTAESRTKTFATCGSHLMIVTLFYGTSMVVYLGQKSMDSSEKIKPMTIFYIMVIPAINPLIYAVRNKAVKRALSKLGNRKIHLQRSWH